MLLNASPPPFRSAAATRPAAHPRRHTKSCRACTETVARLTTARAVLCVGAGVAAAYAVGVAAAAAVTAGGAAGATGAAGAGAVGFAAVFAAVRCG